MQSFFGVDTVLDKYSQEGDILTHFPFKDSILYVLVF